MSYLFSYSLSSAVILCFGYIAYKWLLADERQHTFNRIALYCIYIMSLVLPMMIDIFPHITAASGKGGIEIGAVTGGFIDSPVAYSSSAWISTIILRLLIMIYLAGIIVMTVYSLSAVMSLRRIISNGEKEQFGRWTLVITDRNEVAPFSWMSYIVISRKDYDSYTEAVICHELRHLELRHWMDMLLAQIVVILQWFNPAAWLMRDEFRNVHEYQADEAVIRSGADIKEYQMMLIKKAVGTRFQSLANSLRHSKLKKRVTMMYKKQSPRSRRFGAVALIPAMLLGAAVTQIPAVASALQRVNATPLLATVSVKASTDASTSVESKVNKKTPASEEEVYTAVSEMAEYPGGMKAMMEFLKTHIQYPEEAEKNGEQGRVIVKFIIDKNGKVTSPEVIRGISPLLDKEALRVVSEMPNWTPGKNNGKVVNSYFTLPVSFTLPSSSTDSTTTEN
ncbi:MAG: M56 family metallopeptidase [Muribaculaceae bacterium]|nr:M56 family metallopeptidase [Muribaculaceae bacterium]